MKVVINGKEREVADRELGRRIKMLDLERSVLVSMERIARERLFAASSKKKCIMGQSRKRSGWI